MQEWCNTRWVCLNNFEWLSSIFRKPNIIYIYILSTSTCICVYKYKYIYIYISMHIYMYIYIYICRGCGQGFRLVTALHWPFFLLPLKPLRRYTRNWLAPLQMLKPPGCCTRHKASMNLHKPLPGLLELS